MISFVLAWTLSCAQYHNAVQRLYADPFFKQPQYHQQREEIHQVFKSRTWPECLELET